MDIFKQYIKRLRHLSLNEPYIIINEDIAPKLKNYIRLLNEIKFEDGSYHSYYGEIKTILNSFIDFWTDTMDEAIIAADRCSHCIHMEELIELTNKTITAHQEKQIDFEQHFQPVGSLEKEIYDNLQEKYTIFMERLLKMQEEIKKLDKQSKIDCIRVSLEDILNRLRNNVRTMQEMSEVNISHLLIRLYEKNKEHLMLSRQDFRSSVELAEVQRSMDIIKDKIEDSKHIPMQRLQEEFKYWDGKVHELQQIEKTLKKLQVEEENVLEQEKMFHCQKNTEIPAAKRKCWEHVEEQFKHKLDEIKKLKLKAANALLSFFSVRGPDRIFYSDNIGTYFVDDYGHQCYVFDYGLKNFHVNCQGDFVEVHDKDRYFYDNMGRFIINKSGERFYQAAPCSSTYKIKNDLFVKDSSDCGYSEKMMKECCMTIKDPTDELKIPEVKPVDIKGKLDPEVVKYLWDTFSHVLPEVLCDVAEKNSNNPIHELAHRLLSHKYGKTGKELLAKRQEAIMYREKIQKDRIEKIKEKHEAWKAKQVKRRKPEELDDADERFAYNTHILQQDFIRSLENYD